MKSLIELQGLKVCISYNASMVSLAKYAFWNLCLILIRCQQYKFLFLGCCDTYARTDFSSGAIGAALGSHIMLTRDLSCNSILTSSFWQQLGALQAKVRANVMAERHLQQACSGVDKSIFDWGLMRLVRTSSSFFGALHGDGYTPGLSPVEADERLRRKREAEVLFFILKTNFGVCGQKESSVVNFVPACAEAKASRGRRTSKNHYEEKKVFQ